MVIGRCKVNHLENPLGFEMEETVFSWVVSESTGTCAAAARIEVCLDGTFEELVYDSGRSEAVGAMSHACPVELELLPRTRYYWRVSVWADDGDFGTGPVNWFETGKRSEPWEAEWITAPFRKPVHPYLRREFALEEEVKEARAYVCGLGLYELELNGRKAGEEYLMPGYCDYSRWLQYQTYDVTDMLKKGRNCIGAMLGNGWYKGRFGFQADMEALYGDRMQFICELRITTESGRTHVIATGEDWECLPSPVLESSIYNGEVYDARLAVPSWSMAECEEWKKHVEEGCPISSQAVHAWKAPVPSAPLVERYSLPLTIRERRKPLTVIRTLAGETVIDFGQEITGWMEFPCSAPAGAEVLLKYGEILQDGNFYNDNLRTAKAEYRFISDGTACWVRPHFTYYGFRYVCVSGLSDEEMMAAEGCVIYSGLEHIGDIETSDGDINRLFQNALWSQKGNFLDVPTDCPQRDERMGWTGDAQVFAATASFNMDTAAFYRKYLHDMLLEQRDLGGSVPDVVPDAIGRIHEILGDNKRNAGACAWGDAATVIPWTVYLFFGDRKLLESQFENMCLWVDYIKSVDETECGGSRLWTCGFHYGDWLALDNPDKESRFGGTDCYYVASAYYYYSASLTAKAAAVLGRKEEELRYGRLAEEVKAAFQKKYFTPAGVLTIDTQTALVMALYLHLSPDGKEGEIRLAERLREKLDANGCHLETGFVGTPWLCPVLSANGLKEYAYTLLFHDDFPSWLYEVHMGATTIWERWNSVLPDGKISGTGMNSLNHYAYGSIAEWMYRCMCGINPVMEAPGFKRAVIRPQTDGRLTKARAVYQSPYGEYVSGWERHEEETVYQVKIPFGASAEFVLEERGKAVQINGKESEALERCGSVELAAGEYTVTVRF
ncbi:MAG: glycoside hydrolase family 78 protein [Clostridiales bacterium]|nr:glycoside hydrolase family 78 protein [Clostridiales bacterium]